MMNGSVALPSWLLTHEERRRRDAILQAKFVLVRIAGNAGYDVMRCTRCNGKHQFLTLMCEPQPFNGAERGIYAYYRVAGAEDVKQFMTPEQQARFRRLAELMGPIVAGPDLATSHPQTARGLATPEGDMDFGGIALGLLEPVSQLVAERFVDRINAKGLKPPLEVPGLNGVPVVWRRTPLYRLGTSPRILGG